MKANMKLLLIAMVLLFTTETTLAGPDSPPPRTSSVAEMMQRKQENQLREQLAKVGRWDEIRQMDEEQLRRQQVQTKQTLTRLNVELAREGTVDTAVNGDGVASFCAPVRVPTRLEAQKAKQVMSSGGTDTRSVR